MSETFNNIKFDTDMNINAKVRRESVQSSDAVRAGSGLTQIGKLLNPKPDTLKHLGSAAIHIYQSEILEQLFFVSQTGPLNNTPEILASKAMTALKEDMKVEYGRKRTTKRSGL